MATRKQLVTYRFPASTTAAASFNAAHGTAPSAPVNGDFWTTTDGLFGRFNGSTVGPFRTSHSTVAGSAPSSPVTGDLWFDSTDGGLSVWNGTWVGVGGAALIDDVVVSGVTAYSSSKVDATYAKASAIKMPTSDVSMVSSTANQFPFGSFNAEANTTYLFEAWIVLGTGTTSHTVSFGVTGTATTTAARMWTEFVNVANNGTPTAPVMFHRAALTVSVISAASVLSSKAFRVRGMVRVTTAGTLIPTIKFSAAPGGTNTLNQESFFIFTPVGSNADATIGSWV